MNILEKMQVLTLMVYCLFTGACEKFVTVDPPNTQLVTGSVFASDETARAAMDGLYSTMQSAGGFASGGDGSIGYLAGLSSDELTNYLAVPNRIQFYLNDLDKNNADLYYFLWQLPYQTIYQANGILEGVSASSELTPAVREELKGEAKFIRAFCNFYLTNLYGPVPLINSTDYRINAVVARTNQAAVYEQIIADLQDAQHLLADDYAVSNEERVRPNVWAATALLSRVYLFMGDWEKAELESSLVIDKTDLYELLPDLNQVFLKTSREAIWQLMPNTPNQNTGEGYIYILESEPVYATLSPQMTSTFESGDKRFLNWVRDTTIESATYYYPFKYKVKSGIEVSEYSMVLRLAEQYLIRAEARAHLNNISDAASDINRIRSRAGLDDLNIADRDSLLLAIEHERQVELFTEWGIRWFDLKRTGRATEVLSPIKNNWQPTDTLYPIPQEDIQRNPNLTQNPGY